MSFSVTVGLAAVSCLELTPCFGGGITLSLPLSFFAHSPVTIQDATNGASYRGLLVQARLAADNTTAVGTFSDFTDNTRASDCDPTTVY